MPINWWLVVCLVAIPDSRWVRLHLNLETQTVYVGYQRQAACWRPTPRRAHLQEMASHAYCCIFLPLRGDERGREGKAAGLRVRGRGGGRSGEECRAAESEAVDLPPHFTTDATQLHLWGDKSRRWVEENCKWRGTTHAKSKSSHERLGDVKGAVQ